MALHNGAHMIRACSPWKQTQVYHIKQPDSLSDDTNKYKNQAEDEE